MLKFIFYIVFMIPFCVLNNWVMFIYMLFFFFFFFFCSFVFSHFCFVSFFFGLDSVSYIFICLSIWICILMVFSMYNYMKKLGSVYFLFCVIFLLMMLFLVFSVMDFFYFYFFFEGSLIPVFLIIFGWGYQPERFSAGFYLIFYTLFASLPFLVCIFYIYSVFGGFMFFFVIDFKSMYFLMFFVILSFLVKFPLFGLHIWLPSAHVEAPASGSMILAGVLLSLGGYGFYRCLSFLYYFIFYYGFFFISLSLWGCILISMFCLIQSDLKILIAYSSVCHMSIVICGLFTLSSWGVLGSMIFMMGHGFVSSGLFFLVSVIYNNLGSRSLFIISGLINFLPSLSLFWFLFCSMNMSCPPTVNLASEISVVFSLLGWSWYTFFFLFIILFFSACYSLSIFFLTQHGEFNGLLKFAGLSMLLDYFVLLMHFFPVIFLMMDMFFFFDIF